MKIKDSVILITGGASGIGEATAEYLSSLGGIVYICDIDIKNGEKVSQKGKIKFIKCDVSNEKEVKILIEAIYSEQGRIDVVVNNAGISGLMDTDLDIKISLENFKKIYQINVLGVFLVAKYAAEKMIKNYDLKKECNGVIINISSVLGIHGTKGMTSYSMSKAALIGMTLPMARDLGKYKIRVNAICPGFIPTPLSSVIEAKSLKSLVMSTPLKRLGKPIEIAQAIESAVVNDFFNGSVMKVDGGIVANF